MIAGNIVKVTDDIDFTGTKPHSMRFNNKTFCYSKSQGWKQLYIDVAKELYKMFPEDMKYLAASQIEFVISDEPVCWMVHRKSPAKNYDNNWWAEIATDVYIFVKNCTMWKLHSMKQILECLTVAPSQIKVVLY